MKEFIKINVLVLIIFVLIGVMTINVFADEEMQSEQENSIKEESKLDVLQKEKNELEQNRNQTNSQIEIVENELSDVLVKIQEISLDISNKSEEITKLTVENKKLDIYIKNVKKDLDKITEKYEQDKSVLESRLIASYEMGQTTYLDLLLNSKGIISFISNYYLLSEIMQKDEELIEESAAAKAYMEDLENQLNEKSLQLEENIKVIQKNKISLENMMVLKNKRIEELNESEILLLEEMDNYTNEIESIEKEIRLLSIANVGAEYVGGTMAWPVPGYTRITSPFGMRTHPITGIYKLHTGTDIGAPIGADFIAANDGVVTKAGFNTAYGNMVIIDHGGGISTLYAHGSEILVQEGDIVTTGTPILKVGSTGYSTGPHAHFEVRVNGEYQNPIDYITSYNSNTEVKEEVVVTEN